MAKYYAYLIGEGEGCDYTIGCNHALVTLNAKTLEEAKTEIVDGDYSARIGADHGEGIESIQIFVVDRVYDLDISKVVDAREAAVKAAKKADSEKEERAMYKRLRAKFGGART